MTNSVDPDQTAPIEQSDLGPPCLLLYLDLLIMLDNYLQQTTSADVIFQMHFFLGALRVKSLHTNNTRPVSFSLEHIIKYLQPICSILFCIYS